MKQLVSHLWFDKEAKEAVKWYTSLFTDSEIYSQSLIQDTPSGDADFIDFRIENMRFNAISAGPFFKLNPSISLMVDCQSKEEVNRLYEAFSEGGFVLMPLGEYDFSPWYAWVQDKYGVSWQLYYPHEQQDVPKLRVSMLFAQDHCGQAEEAIHYYAQVFEGTEVGYLNRYPENAEGIDTRAKINYGELNSETYQMVMMDHGMGGDFMFNEAFSFVITCETQEEIDYYWNKLSKVPEAEQCGWAKDQFGVSWQIVPSIMQAMMVEGTEKQRKAVQDAFMQMKKFDLKVLRQAFNEA